MRKSKDLGKFVVGKKVVGHSYRSVSSVILGLSLIVGTGDSLGRGKKAPKGPIDFTKGVGKVALNKPWNIGATGIKGYFDKYSPRQILVAKVAKGSPAYGRVFDQDVILGVNGLTKTTGCKDGKFVIDAHRAMALAIEEIEKKGGKNTLSLKIWRPKTKVEKVKENPRFRKSPMIEKRVVLKPLEATLVNVTLTLEELGTFSAESPWKCEKAESLIEKTAERIIERGFTTVSSRGGKVSFFQRIDRVMDALGILATGNEKYLPEVKKYAHSFIKKGEKLDINKLGEKDARDYTIGSWAGAFNNIFLCEYYLRTKDAAVLPAIKSYAVFLARGVSGVGTWSHGVAAVDVNGMYGPPTAYGAMNQATALCATSLVLAKKCGVKDPSIDKAIKLSLGYFDYYVDKGCLPYGDHAPVVRHDANGRMSIAAIFCDLAGSKKQAEYYTRMALASHRKREGGHATDIFSWQWGNLAAARGGAQSASKFSKSTRYFSELARRFDGSSVYQPMRSKDNLKTGEWSIAGSFLMQYCLSRKAIYLTGRGDTCVTPIVGQDLKNVLAYGTFAPKSLSVDKLLEALESYSVVVREKASEELGLRNVDLVDKLLLLLNKSDNRFARYGACQALSYAGNGSPKVFEKLVTIAESDKDWTARYFALKAFTIPGGKKYTGERRLGKVPKNFGPRLLKIAALKDSLNDPRRKLPAMLPGILFDKNGIYAKQAVAELESGVLTPAIASLLQNPNGGARSQAATALPFLSEKGMEPLWGVLHDAMINPAPSGVMFGGGINYNGNKVMAKYHIKEGLPLATWWVFEKKGWGDHTRKKGLASIAPYGSLLDEHVKKLHNAGRNYTSWRDVKKGMELIKKTPAPELKSIQKYIDEFKKNKGKVVLDD